MDDSGPNMSGPNMYTVSRMLDVVRSQSMASGVEVEVKKKMSDGAYIPVDDEDIDMADFDVKLKQVVEHIATLSKAEKKKFSFAMRDAGNEKFYDEDYKAALEMYAQAMAGLESTNEHKNLREVALPILTNMAFCFLVLRKPKLALTLCDEALEIDPENVKAHFRRGKALAALDRYAEAKVAFGKAGPDPAPARELRALARTAHRIQKVRAAQRKTFATALQTGVIYDDKPTNPRAARLKRARALADDGNLMLAKALSSGTTTNTTPTPDDRQRRLGSLVSALVLVAALFYVFLD